MTARLKGADYAMLQREEASNKALFDNLLSRTKETGVSGQFKGSNITIVDPAETPRSPFSPNIRRDLMPLRSPGGLHAWPSPSRLDLSTSTAASRRRTS